MLERDNETGHLARRPALCALDVQRPGEAGFVLAKASGVGPRITGQQCQPCLHDVVVLQLLVGQVAQRFDGLEELRQRDVAGSEIALDRCDRALPGRAPVEAADEDRGVDALRMCERQLLGDPAAEAVAGDAEALPPDVVCEPQRVQLSRPWKLARNAP